MDRLLRELNQIQRLHAIQCDYEKTLVVLAYIKSGEVAIDQVNLIEGGWRLAEAEQELTPLQAVPVDAESQ